jgi:hypothetical protein
MDRVSQGFRMAVEEFYPTLPRIIENRVIRAWMLSLARAAVGIYRILNLLRQAFSGDRTGGPV